MRYIFRSTVMKNFIGCWLWLF
ncbi:hypothetical protein MTR67_019619 [Solanum verrucosum]|uniref:Uncharacterized protein n=1 Tax=Solanum verrucosum TaxID=315347 RepID=A0AAF0QLU3_SOLVR|nr:hypothetical protein MTR67_019619 [Solanum verrucosum]